LEERRNEDIVGTGHFGEQRNNQGRQLEKGPEKEHAPDNREKQCEEAGKSKEEGHGSTTHAGS
jgi:hypothetical protein